MSTPKPTYSPAGKLFELLSEGLTRAELSIQQDLDLRSGIWPAYRLSVVEEASGR